MAKKSEEGGEAPEARAKGELERYSKNPVGFVREVLRSDPYKPKSTEGMTMQQRNGR